MKRSLRIPAMLALTLALTVPALAQSSHQGHATPAAPAAAPAVNPDKAYLLHQEYVAKTAELRGKIVARQAALETLLATKPDDEAAVKKLVAEISALRGSLYEQTTLFRLRYAKETGTPIRLTRELGRKGGHGPMMEGMDGGQGMSMCQGKADGLKMPMGAMKMDMSHGARPDGHQGLPMPAAPTTEPAAPTAKP